MRSFLAVSLGKSIRFLLRQIRRGGGSALPGLIASFIAPNLLKSSLGRLRGGVVLISGSAGKSSTTDLIVQILRSHGQRVFTNPSTANIKQGLFAAVLSQGDLRGRLDYDMAVLEVDEGHGAALLGDLAPRLVVLTNVLSDQLDRFVDPSFVAEKLATMASAAKQSVINAHDPNLRAMKLNNIAASVTLDADLAKSPLAPTYALRFDEPKQLSATAVLSGMGPYSLDVAGTQYQIADSNVPHALNTALAILASSLLVKISPEKIKDVLSTGQRVFARNESVQLEGREINLRLVQNPTSFQLNVDELTSADSPLMLMAGSDIHDPSWLWTVDFSALAQVDIVSGRNAFDLALRLSYAGVNVGKVLPEISEAKDAFMAIPGNRPTILFSADSMRRFRRLTGLAK